MSSARRYHAGVGAREVDRLVAVPPADPIVLPLALPAHPDHLALPPECIERGGVDDDLVTRICMHPVLPPPTGGYRLQRNARDRQRQSPTRARSGGSDRTPTAVARQSHSPTHLRATGRPLRRDRLGGLIHEYVH